MMNSDLSYMSVTCWGPSDNLDDADVNGKKRLLTATEVGMNGLCISVLELMPS